MNKRVFASQSPPDVAKAKSLIPRSLAGAIGRMAKSRNGRVALAVVVLAALVVAIITQGPLGRMDGNPLAGRNRPLPMPTDGVLPASAPWPLSGVPGLITRANTVMRTTWQADAVLMTLEAKPGKDTGVEVFLTYYSPSARNIRTLQPGAAGAALGQVRQDNRDTRQSVPDQVTDLPAALARAGLQPGDVREADLQWTRGNCGTGEVRRDGGPAPRCPPGSLEGVQWRLIATDGQPRLAPAAR